jgi:hypothetical protein
MKKLVLSDIKNLHEYELIRPEWRKSVIEEKARRRLFLGSKMTLVFENRITVLNQVQEMCRAERIVKPEAVQQEIDVYNELLPGPGEVSGTLMIEIIQEDLIKPELDGLVGLGTGKHIWLEIASERYYARFLEGQGRDDRISAVQYIRFPLGGNPGLRSALETGGIPAKLVIDHPGYRASVDLSLETKRELARDLTPD